MCGGWRGGCRGDGAGVGGLDGCGWVWEGREGTNEGGGQEDEEGGKDVGEGCHPGMEPAVVWIEVVA